MIWLLAHDFISMAAWNRISPIYMPLEWLARQWPDFEDLMQTYISIFLSNGFP